MDSHDEADGDMTDLYALLGVKRSATKNEIRKAYRSLARTFHPDHHTTGDERSAAEHKFVKINQAYNVLIDDEQRAVYDIYGLEALKSNNCKDLVRRYPTLDELKQHLEKAEKEKELKELRHKFKAKGKIISVLAGFKRTPELYHLPLILGVQIHETMQNQIDPRNQLLVGGSVGKQQSNIVFGWRHFFSEIDRTTFADAQVIAGPEMWNLQLLGQTKLTATNVGAAIASMNHEGGTLTLHFWETLSERVLADAQFSAGLINVMRLGLRRQAETTVISSHIKVTNSFKFSDIEWIGDWPFSLPSLELDYTKKLNKRESLKLETELGFDGIPSIAVGYTRRISKGNKLSISSGLGGNGACTVSLSYHYYGQQLMFPIVMTQGFDAWTTLGSFVFPILGVLVASRYWFNPLRERRKKQKKAEMLRLRSEAVQKRRQQAEMDVRLIQAQAKRRIEAERAKNGLVLVLAQYGKWKSTTQEGEEGEEAAAEGSVIDVTIPLQYKVEDSQLVLEEGSKASLYGFYDPCPGDQKQLRIRYMFKNKMHQILINEEEELVIPLKEHLIEEIYTEDI